MTGKSEQTPLMKQYWGIKAAHLDKIVLFRMGDFFEMFHEDAQVAAPILGIALTVRNKKSGDQTPMCGVPHHSIGAQINNLLAAGKKVAICDQVEDPKLAKGLVKREVTRILSPGMVYDPDTLDGMSPHYVCAKDASTLAFMDSTTGECFYYAVNDPKKVQQLLETLNPVEIVLSEEQDPAFISPNWKGTASLQNSATPVEGLPESASRLLDYAKAMQGEDLLRSLKPFELRQTDFRMMIPAKVARHLEIFLTYQGMKQGSLFTAMDRTKTSGGARRLKSFLLFPVCDRVGINERLDSVEFWSKDIDQLKEIRKTLGAVGDMERRLGKISQPTAHPRDMQSLLDSLDAAVELFPHLDQQRLGSSARDGILQLRTHLAQALAEEIPNNFREGGFIRAGFDSHLDELVRYATNSQGEVRDLENQERQLTGISSLKIRYNNVFGFYIEITNTHKSKVPTDRYQRKQTLANAERYITDELNELEKKVVTAKTKRIDVELEIFADLKKQIITIIGSLYALADECNQLDVYTALAWLALEQSYVRPQFQDNGAIELESSRHPVIEQSVATPFIANNIVLKPHQCLLLTGPNMAGKSTLMRQVAVTCIMAQVGSFVPASKANLPVVDKIFTRIGASDSLTEGLSTFMVEMQETAEMLSGATENSLVVLDEVGRGTSTYDGMSLAQAILEYFLRKLKSYTLFATHYHELTGLETRYPDILVNKHMAISETDGKISFRYQLVSGPAQKSYGIHVAKLAGLPDELIKYAGQLLNRMESQSQEKYFLPKLEPKIVKIEAPVDHQLLDSIRKLEIQKLTPLDALNKLAKWQQELS